MSAPWTPSGRHRAESCPASTYLPRERRPAEPAGVRGTDFHAFAVRCGVIGYLDALAEVPVDAAHRSLCESVNPLLLPIDWTTARQEIAFAYDPRTDTARELAGITDRNYAAANPPLAPHEIPGTIDLLEWAAGLVVSDWKTGRWSAAYRPQIRTYALMAARALGVDAVSTRIMYPDETTGEVTMWTESMDAWDLEAEAASVRVLTYELGQARLAWESGGVPDTRPGEHCRYCESRPLCPEYSYAGRELAHHVDRSTDETRAALLSRVRLDLGTADGRARWWRFVELAPVMLAEIQRAVESAAPFVLPDGREVRAVTQLRRSVTDPDAIAAELVRLGHDTNAIFAAFSSVTRRHATIGSLTDALGGKKTAAPVLRDLLERGIGITAGTTTTYEAVRPPRVKGSR